MSLLLLLDSEAKAFELTLADTATPSDEATEFLSRFLALAFEGSEGMYLVFNGQEEYLDAMLPVV